jgi:hypothetical protein
MAPVRRNNKVKAQVAEVAEIDETPTTETVPQVETEEVVETAPTAPTRRGAPKQMTAGEIDAIESFVSFLNEADDLSAQFIQQGMLMVFQALLAKGNKTTATKLSAALIESVQAHTASMSGGKTKKKTARKPTAQKVIQVQPEFASVLQNGDIQGITMKNGKTIAKAIINADEGDGIGLANNAFLSVFWGILAEYFQTEKKENGEPCYPKHPDTNKAGAHLAKASKKLPKELTAFLKKVNKEWVMMTEAMTVVKNHIKTDVVMGSVEPEVAEEEQTTEE